MGREFNDDIGKEVVEAWVSVMPDEVSEADKLRLHAPGWTH